MTDSYLLNGRTQDVGDEIHIHGDAGGGTIAFKKEAVKVTAGGIEVPKHAAPRLVVSPHTASPGADAARQATAQQVTTDQESDANGLSGWYCICIGQACYTYQCSDNKYLGECFPVPCAYYNCKTGGC